jgi:predicted component of viral defense system (DUF524 family)
LENRDVATLYELWVYFAVIEAVERRLGRPVRAEAFSRGPTQVDVPWRYRVTWPGGVELSYNQTFSPGSGPATSWSVQLRPDVVLTVPVGSDLVRHVFDAKFKVERLDATAEDDDDTAERVRVFRKGDIYKMHAYRDALPEVYTAWVVYPGKTEQRWEDPRGDGGVGAVPAEPGAEDHLRGLVSRLLTAAGHGAE